MDAAGRFPEDIKININTIGYEIDLCIDDYCHKYNIDLNDYKTRSGLKHNEVNHILKYIYNNLLKPNKSLINNQKSVIDYNDIYNLTVIADKFLDICMLFNKSLGLYSFSIFTGISFEALTRWVQEGRAPNPARYDILKSIIDFNRASLIAMLKDSSVGQIAVANNDVETGLEWTKNNVSSVTNNNVFLLPSERLEALKIERMDKRAAALASVNKA